MFQNPILYFIFRKFCFNSRSTANLLTVIANIIASVLKTFGANLDIYLLERLFTESGILLFFQI